MAKTKGRVVVNTRTTGTLADFKKRLPNQGTTKFRGAKFSAKNSRGPIPKLGSIGMSKATVRKLGIANF